MFNKPQTWRVRKIDSLLGGTLLGFALPWLLSPPHSSWLSVTVISSNRLSVSRPRRQKESSKQTRRAVEDVTKGQGSVI